MTRRRLRQQTISPDPPRTVASIYRRIWADTPAMNDFHIALLWLHSLEALVGESSMLMLSEVELDDLFVRYRSPYKA